jgi:tetratricopeptide (TPR) repeat protein
MRIRLIGALAAGALLGWSPAVSSAAADPTAEARYRDCMALARTSPRQALAAVEKWPRGGDAADHCWATALFGLERYGEAAERFETLAGRPSSPGLRAPLLAQAARAWLMADAPGRAIGLLDQAAALAPDDVQLLIDRAEARAALGRYGDAIDDLTRAISREPGLLDAYVLRASAYRRVDRLDHARLDLDLVLRLDPAHPEALLERGVVRRRQGDEDGARGDWREVLRLAPGTAAAAAAQSYLDPAPPSLPGKP